MSLSSSLSKAGAAQVASEERLRQIVRATTELNRCVAERGNYKDDFGQRAGVLLGECDWRAELERLLYEDAV